MTRRLGRRVMIIVPSFSERQHSNPKAVGRHIASGEPLRAPHMCCGIDKPSGVETYDRAQKNAPE